MRNSNRSYQLTDDQSDYLVNHLRQTNGKALGEIAGRLNISHPRYVWILYRRIVGKTFTEDGYGNARRWRFMKPKQPDQPENDEQEYQSKKGNEGKSRVPPDMKPCDGCEILVPIGQAYCEDCGKRLIRLDEFDETPYRSQLGQTYRYH